MRQVLPKATLEVRMDSAFFSDEIIRALEAIGILYTISVPFDRFRELKVKIEKRRLWQHADRQSGFFQCRRKPKCWERERRFLFIRTREPIQRKQPVQLSLFTPHQYGYQLKVILANMPLSARKVLALHNARGAQEGAFAELKSQTQMEYIPAGVSLPTRPGSSRPSWRTI